MSEHPKRIIFAMALLLAMQIVKDVYYRRRVGGCPAIDAVMVESIRQIFRS